MCQEDPGTLMHVVLHGYILTEIVIVELVINVYFIACVHEILQHVILLCYGFFIPCPRDGVHAMLNGLLTRAFFLPRACTLTNVYMCKGNFKISFNLMG
jgi:hypothetical protein